MDRISPSSKRTDSYFGEICQNGQGLGPAEAIVEIPRYQEFTTDVRMLAEHGVRFRQIAGNELVVVSVVAPSGWATAKSNLQLLLKQPVLTAQTGRTRAVLLGRVSDLHEMLPWLERQGLEVEHLYDY